MAWMSDEAYDFVTDSRDKKNIARSARNTRTHCGKGGAVKFPSDYMSAKELKSMNGECKSYRLNSPMKWDEFKAMPDDLKVVYINALRQKYNVPDKEIAEMLGVDARGTLYRWFKCLGLNKGYGSGNKTKTWNQEGWVAWLHGLPANAVKDSETPIEEEVQNDIPAEDKDELIAVNDEPDIKVTTLEEEIGSEAAEQVEELLHEVVNIIEGRGEQKPVEDHSNACQCKCETKLVVPTSGEMEFRGNIDDILRTIGHLLNGKNVELEVEWKVLD